MAEGRHGRRPSPGRAAAEGLGLVELLVAVSLATVVLGASWAWLWDCGEVALRAEGDSQAFSAAAFAMRAIAADVEVAATLAAPPAPLSPRKALYVRQRSSNGEDETVLIAWDAGRDVVWRQARGTYLADHVCDFALCYFRADGTPLDETDLQDPSWPIAVARVSVTMDVADGKRTLRLCRNIDLPAA